MLAAPNGALAQTGCWAEPLMLQVLGSGGPFAGGTRASTGYLIWRDGRALVMIDAGGGTFLRFGEAGARLQDLSLLAISHLHPDHVSDLPALLWLSEQARRQPLRVAGPSGAGPIHPLIPSSRGSLIPPAAHFPYWAAQWVKPDKACASKWLQSMRRRPPRRRCSPTRTSRCGRWEFLTPMHRQSRIGSELVTAALPLAAIRMGATNGSPALPLASMPRGHASRHLAARSRRPGASPCTAGNGWPDRSERCGRPSRSQSLHRGPFVSRHRRVVQPLRFLPQAVAEVRKHYLGQVDTAVDLQCIPIRGLPEEPPRR